MKRAFCYVEIV
ncbi:hypothetical protein SAMN04515618_1363 [Collimonas sp. OK307]|nr:hypothetical protein SAMN04515618_1363 [Collimonas sp. OK307]